MILKWRLLRIGAGAAIVGGSIFGFNGVSGALGSIQVSCGGSNSNWGLSSTEGASTSSIPCTDVKVARKLRNPDGGFYYTSYHIDNDGDVEYAGGSTVGGKHVFDNASVAAVTAYT